MSNQLTSTYPTIVVSLSDAASRRKAIRELMQSHNLNFQFFDAVDGRKGLSQEYEGLVDREETLKRLGRSMSDAEYACAISHLEVYKWIMQNDRPGAVVLEDDAIMGSEFQHFVSERVYLKYDMVVLGHEGAKVQRMQQRRICRKYSIGKLCKNPAATVGYSISRKAAEFLYKNSLPVIHPADWGCRLQEIGACAAAPAIIGHPPALTLDSSIEDSRSILLANPPKNGIRCRNKKLRFIKLGYWRGKLLEKKVRGSTKYQP